MTHEARGRLPKQLQTPRLLLRRWVQTDRPAFAALNADERVMEHFPSVLTRAERDAAPDRIDQRFERHGFGLWALEIPGVVPFAGFVGLAVPAFEAHFTSCVEIGWRRGPQHWGFRYAAPARPGGLRFHVVRV